MSELSERLRRLGPAWTHWTPLPVVAWCLYVVLVRGEVRWELITLGLLVPTLAFVGPRTRRLYVGLYPLAVVAVVYDAMRGIKNLGITPERVHVCDLHDHELALFGIRAGASRVTLQDYFYIHHADAADLFFAVPYGSFILVSVVFAVFLYRASFVALQRYTWTFLVLNLVAFVTYHVYPAAPPWYFHLTGSCVADLSAHASEGVHLANADRMLGVLYFHGFYGRSSDIFGAVPSLHVAYPLLIVLEGWSLFEARRWLRVAAVAFTVWMCAAAVYLDHHYVIDVLLGLMLTVAVHLGFRALFRRLGIDREPLPIAAAAVVT